MMQCFFAHSCRHLAYNAAAYKVLFNKGAEMMAAWLAPEMLAGQFSS